MKRNPHAVRKDEHVRHALQQSNSIGASDLEQVRFVHNSLNEIGINDVKLNTQLGPIQLETPFFINAMTGGSKQTNEINEQLAIVAKETGLAMATGSMSIALQYSKEFKAFKAIRQTNPDGVIFANLGANHSVERAKLVVNAIEANALQLHLNAPQEMVMPEGDRDFSGLLHNIEKIVTNLHVPVIVKEVGFGMSKKTVQQLESVGVSFIDISGRGGTNFIRIENARRTNDYSLNLLSDWGQTTLESLLEATSVRQHAQIIASGGIKSALDIAKCLSLGANAVGLSAYFLQLITRYGADETIEQVNIMKEQLKVIMTLLGANDIKTLQQVPIVLPTTTRAWCAARGIDFSRFAKR